MSLAKHAPPPSLRLGFQPSQGFPVALSDLAELRWKHHGRYVGLAITLGPLIKTSNSTVPPSTKK
jgi:hypothetical protein